MGVWVSIACIGYGLALQKFGQGQQAGGLGATDVREGRVKEAKILWPQSRGIEVKVEGDDAFFRLPSEFIPADEKAWKETEYFLRSGTKIRLRFHVKDRVIVELIANPNNVFQRNLVTAEVSSAKYSAQGQGVSSQGQIWIRAGIAVLPLELLILGGFALYFRRRRQNARVATA